VPTEASEVAVVDGKPEVSGRPVPFSEEPSSEVRNGASSGWARSSSQPMPSTRNTQTRSAGANSSPVAGSSGQSSSMPRSAAGSRSASDASP
jgi:hypothetical protein